MGDQLKALDQVKTSAIDLAVKFGPKLLVALLILYAGHLVGRVVGRAAGRMLEHFDIDATLRTLIERIVRVVVFGLFLIMALQNLGVELLPLIAGLGVAGAGIALAMQGVLGNLAAGLTIIFTRPFKVGDYLSIASEEGEVLEMSLFSTVLGHPDLSRVVIPNRKIVGEILHNYGALRQLGVAVGVAYDTDISAALRAIDDVLKDNSRVLQDPAPVVRVGSLDDSSVTLRVLPWVKIADYGAAGSEVTRAILEKFRAAGITIPFPQREVRMLGDRG